MRDAPQGRRAAVLGTRVAGSAGIALQVGTAGGRPSLPFWRSILARGPGGSGSCGPGESPASGTSACVPAGRWCPRVRFQRAAATCSGDCLELGLRVSRTPGSAGNCVVAGACPRSMQPGANATVPVSFFLIPTEQN